VHTEHTHLADFLCLFAGWELTIFKPLANVWLNAVIDEFTNCIAHCKLFVIEQAVDCVKLKWMLWRGHWVSYRWNWIQFITDWIQSSSTLTR
jgi:hypothetical protein